MKSAPTEELETNPRWLEIGSGMNPTPGYVHIDVNPNAPHVEIVGDVRVLFIPQDFEGEIPSALKHLDTSHTKSGLGLFDRIRLFHFVEHIHWYNQPSMWRWLWLLLDEGGMLEIATPDLEYVLKTYTKQLRKFSFFSRKVRFPQEEHPDISGHSPADLSRWVTFKLYSGGSYSPESGLHDYHLGLYDRYRLQHDLETAGFRAIKIRRRRGSLLAKAFRGQTEGKEDDFYVG